MKLLQRALYLKKGKYYKISKIILQHNFKEYLSKSCFLDDYHFDHSLIRIHIALFLRKTKHMTKTFRTELRLLIINLVETRK